MCIPLPTKPPLIVFVFFVVDLFAYFVSDLWYEQSSLFLIFGFVFMNITFVSENNQNPRIRSFVLLTKRVRNPLKVNSDTTYLWEVLHEKSSSKGLTYNSPLSYHKVIKIISNVSHKFFQIFNSFKSFLWISCFSLPTPFVISHLCIVCCCLWYVSMPQKILYMKIYFLAQLHISISNFVSVCPYLLE